MSHLNTEYGVYDFLLPRDISLCYKRETNGGADLNETNKIMLSKAILILGCTTAFQIHFIFVYCNIKIT